ncbi:hypothetical protein EB232_22225 [Mesorhizobium sp. NZP2077]|nr:hypothetical protein EB232_22225 [Mesorhizobium sp. NZP2077]QKD20179.1 hypothetical protein HGP13_21930 [Mesorhizobium sp. NZP2077]
MRWHVADRAAKEAKAKAPVLDQVDVVLAEDGKSVALYGYTSDDQCFTQSFAALPMAIDEENIIDDEWRAAADPTKWVRL